MNLLTRIKNIVNICKLAVSQSGKWKVTLQDDQTLSNIPHAQNFGFKGSPPVGSRGVLLSRAGEQSAGILIIVDNDDGAPGLATGEVAVYNDHGATIILKANGNIEVDGGDVLINGGNLEITAGDVEASGDVSDTNATTPTMISMRNLFNAHIHNVSGAVTGPPTSQQ